MVSSPLKERAPNLDEVRVIVRKFQLHALIDTGIKAERQIQRHVYRPRESSQSHGMEEWTEGCVISNP